MPSTGDAERYQVLADTVTCPVAWLSAELVFLDLNHQAELFFGVTAAEVMGRRFADVAAVLRHRDGIVHDLERALAGQELSWCECSLDTPGGRDRVIMWTARALRDGSLLLVGHDLTEHRRLERELERGRRSEEVSSLTTQLVHDIQTPLTAALVAIGGIERLASTDPGRTLAAVRERIEDLHASLQLMVELLGSWKGLAAAARLELGPFSLAELVRDVVRQAAPVAAQRGIQLRCEIAPALPVVRGDRLKLRRALDNLVKNAVEAVDHGPGHVVLRVEATGDGVSIVVRDSGPGLTGNVDVFAPLVTTKPGGLGLGLSIVKQIVEAHGGTIDAAGSTPQGAQFRVLLPAHPPEAR